MVKSNELNMFFDVENALKDISYVEGQYGKEMHIQICGRKTRLICKKSYNLDDDIIRQMEESIEQYIHVYPQEETWMNQTFGVPSAWLRFDSFVHTTGNTKHHITLEVEDRASGLLLFMLANPEGKALVDSVTRYWPSEMQDYIEVVSPNHQWYDGGLRGKVYTLEQAIASDKLVIVRAEPWEKEYQRLAHRSLSTIATEGIKSYGLSMQPQLWKHIHDVSEISQAMWDGGIVIKELQGSKFSGVYLFHKDYKGKGSDTKGKIEKVIQNNSQRGVYIQKFHHPMDSGLPECPYEMLRTYAMYDFVSRKYKIVGGMTYSRPIIRLHGSIDAYCGKIVVG